MFEKEAEEWVKENMDCCKTDNSVNQPIPYFDEEERCCAKSAFQDGAVFGYNKANEWHYMKDVNCYEDLHFPPEEACKGRLCIWKVKDCSENYHCGSYDDLRYEINAYHVIAWKELVLPKEVE